MAEGVDPTDAVSLAQVEQLIAAGAAAAETVRRGSLAPASVAYQVASIGNIDIVPPSAPVAAPVTVANCEFGGRKMVTAVHELASASFAFSPVADSAITFEQRGTEPGCVALSFAAAVLAPAGAVMEVRAGLDGGIEASPGPVLFSQDDEALRSRAFNFLFSDVMPGPHRVVLEFRNAGEGGFVRLRQRRTMLQFAK